MSFLSEGQKFVFNFAETTFQKLNFIQFNFGTLIENFGWK